MLSGPESVILPRALEKTIRQSDKIQANIFALENSGISEHTIFSPQSRIQFSRNIALP